MALTDNANGLSAADVAAVVGNNGGAFGNGFWGDGSFWIIILFLFAFMGNGWGGFGNANAGGVMPYMVNNDVQRGFDHQAVIEDINGINASVNALAQAQCAGFNGVTQAVNNGFYGAEIANNARQIANMQQLNTIAMNQQTCCCENRAAVADLKYTIATEACADRAAVGDALNNVLNNMNGSVQKILDQMCQDKIDAKNERIHALENQLNIAQQNVLFQQGLTNEVDALYNRLKNCPVPAMPVYGSQPIFSCGNGTGCGCGCAG